MSNNTCVNMASNVPNLIGDASSTDFAASSVATPAGLSSKCIVSQGAKNQMLFTMVPSRAVVGTTAMANINRVSKV